MFVALLAAILASGDLKEFGPQEAVVGARRIIKAAYESEGLDFNNPPE